MIEIHSAPYDLGGARQGSRLGPDALRLAGLVPTLIDVLDHADNRTKYNLGSAAKETFVTVGKRVTTDLDVKKEEGKLPFLQPLLNMLEPIKVATAETLSKGLIPMMLGGEHSLSIAPISACLDKYGAELAVLWIDAHADVNTPGVSQSLNVHGMPIALLANLPGEHTSSQINNDWEKLKSVVGTTYLALRQVSWFGLRDVDEGEQIPIQSGFPVSMHRIDRNGIEKEWNRVVDQITASGCKYLYISFDVDVMDPILAPGTGTSVRGGLTYREAHLLAELIHDTLTAPNPPFQLVALDLVEVSPIHDTNNQTATVSVEWLASLFGKRILRGQV